MFGMYCSYVRVGHMVLATWRGVGGSVCWLHGEVLVAVCVGYMERCWWQCVLATWRGVGGSVCWLHNGRYHDNGDAIGHLRMHCKYSGIPPRVQRWTTNGSEVDH